MSTVPKCLFPLCLLCKMSIIFYSGNHTLRDVHACIIAQTTSNINYRLRTEEAWIQTLQTKTSAGLNLNQWTCTTCHKAFASPGNLLRHNTAKHAPEVTKYECWYCGKLYCHRETTIKQTKKTSPRTGHQSGHTTH